MVELEIDTPAGRLSVKLTPASDAAPGLVMVKVSVDVPPGLMLLGEKALMMLALTMLANRAEALKSEL
jgi:hypothetical protein